MALLLLPGLIWAQGEKPGSLTGTVRDVQAGPKEGVTISLEDKAGEHSRTAVSDPSGEFRFDNVPAGTYALKAELAGAKATVWVNLAVGETKRVELQLGKRSASAAPAIGAPDFYDEPQFTVAGVSQGTNSGGHGSDAVLRTTESLAKATTSLANEETNSHKELSPDVERSLRAALGRQPDSFQANYDLGKALAESGRDAEAIPFLRKAAAQAEKTNVSGQPELFHQLGEVEERSGKPLDAVHDYQRAAELDPSERNLFDLGAELLSHRALDPATAIFTKGAALFPQSSRMLLGLGVAWYARGNYEKAATNLIAASNLEPANPAPYIFMGKTLTVQTGAPEGYVTALKRFAELQPDNALANYYYALALKKQRNGASDAASAAQIQALLKKSVELDPRLAEGFLQLGVLLSERGDFPQAIEEYNKAINANPQLEEPHYRLAQAYRRLGEQEEAQEQLKLYEQLSKQSKELAEHDRREMQQFVISLRDDNQRSEQKP
jgi:tetratricopeptide (TPR) repeat protein